MLPLANELKTHRTSEESQRNRKSPVYHILSLTYITRLKISSSCGDAVFVMPMTSMLLLSTLLLALIIRYT